MFRPRSRLFVRVNTGPVPSPRALKKSWAAGIPTFSHLIPCCELHSWPTIISPSTYLDTLAFLPLNPFVNMSLPDLANGDHTPSKLHLERGPGGPGAGLITVQPPRIEDLQPLYAKKLLPDSEVVGSHDSYSSMSVFLPFFNCASVQQKLLTASSQHPWFLHRVDGRHSVLRRLPKPIQISPSRKRWSRHQIWSLLPRS